VKSRLGFEVQATEDAEGEKKKGGVEQRANISVRGSHHTICVRKVRVLRSRKYQGDVHFRGWREPPPTLWRLFAVEAVKSHFLPRRSPEGGRGRSATQIDKNGIVFLRREEKQPSFYHLEILFFVTREREITKRGGIEGETERIRRRRVRFQGKRGGKGIDLNRRG